MQTRENSHDQEESDIDEAIDKLERDRKEMEKNINKTIDLIRKWKERKK